MTAKMKEKKKWNGNWRVMLINCDSREELRGGHRVAGGVEV